MITNFSQPFTQTIFKFSVPHFKPNIDLCQDKTMGGYLGLWSGYLESENAMLIRRQCLIVERVNAVSAFNKAKPAKREAAQLIMEARERDLTAVTKSANGEIR